MLVYAYARRRKSYALSDGTGSFVEFVTERPRTRFTVYIACVIKYVKMPLGRRNNDRCVTVRVGYTIYLWPTYERRACIERQQKKKTKKKKIPN